MPEDNLNILAQIGRGHGVHGAVRVASFTEPPEALLEYGRFHLANADPPRILEVAKAKVHKNNLLIFKFKNITTREAAEALNGCFLGVDRAQMPPLAEDEYYWHDLIGLTVHEKTAGIIGRVRRIFEAGAGPLLEIPTEAGAKEILVPFNENVLIAVELEKGLIRLDLPPGLLDL